MIELLKAELARAREQFPKPPSIYEVVGIMAFKRRFIIEKTDCYQLVHEPANLPWVKFAFLQIAVVCLRYAEETAGGLSDAEYARLVKEADEDKKPRPHIEIPL
jgi:hypothetical protein